MKGACLKPIYGLLCLITIMTSLPLPDGWGGGERDQASADSTARRQRAEFAGFYLQDSTKAELPQTTLSIELYNQAAEYFKRQDYGLAREVLKDALKQDPRNSWAYELLGDIDYVEGDLEAAKENYKKAFQIQSREGLREKLERFLKEAEAVKDTETKQDDLFFLKYPKTCSENEITRLKALLRKQYEKLSRDFGFYFKQPLVVLVYEQEQFRKMTELPHWFGGIYDGNVRIPFCSPGLKEQDVEAAAIHEMTHAFVTGISQGHAPPWLQEGLAVYEDNSFKKREEIVFRAAVKTGTLFPLDQLMNEQRLDFKQDPLLLSLFYEESFEWVNYLIQRFGLVKMKELLTEFAKGKNSDEAIENVYHDSPMDLERAWKDILTN
ncbi:MAG TPA: peptidase MA family metallohydrolase [bacterium]|nr:peptidase MA family metallohydrolase [bacterium]